MPKITKLTPLRAIRALCLDCSGGSAREVRLCVIPHCPLYPFRMGKNPNRSGLGGTPPNPGSKKKAQ